MKHFFFLTLCCLFSMAAQAQLPLVFDFTTPEQDPIVRNTRTGRVTNFVTNEQCGWVTMSLQDTMLAAEPSIRFSPYIVGTRVGGNSIDLRNNLTATMSVWSAEDITLTANFRSGDGATNSRTDRVEQFVPGGGSSFVNITFDFPPDVFLEDFNPADVFDFWFFLDRGNDFFAGNQFIVDDITIGGVRNRRIGSECTPPGDGVVMPPPPAPVVVTTEQFTAGAPDIVSRSGMQGTISNFVRNDECEWLEISIADTTLADLPRFSPYSVNIRNNDAGVNLGDQLTATMSVWSAEEVELSANFRSGDGTAENRTERISQTVPGGGDSFTDVTFTFTGSDIAGLDSSDVIDFWFFLDRGMGTFAGNQFIIDDITIGAARNPNNPSRCIPPVGSIPRDSITVTVEQFSFDAPDLISRNGPQAAAATFQENSQCGWLAISITDTTDMNLPRFSPFQIDLRRNGNSISLDTMVTVTMSVWSAEEVQLSTNFRSGDGSAPNRTDRVIQTVPGGGDSFTDITFDFNMLGTGGLDSSDVIDFWFFLDRGMGTFAGNLFLIDDITIGAPRDASAGTTCNPALLSSTDDDLEAESYKLYPTISSGQVRWDGPIGDDFQVADKLGRVVATGQLQETMDFSELNAGVYYLITERKAYVFMRR